ncbi:MAG: carbohydrate ABC transporter permease, partial [Ferrovibrionaceae bacterium]
MTDDAPSPYETPVTIAPVLRYGVLFLVAGVVLVPLVATALGGFKSLGELRVNPFGLPAAWEWENYWGILASSRYWQLMGNSLIIAGLTVILTVAAAAMAAFVFVHVRFFGATFLLNYLLLGLMFPAATAILPLFIRVRDLG